MLKIKSKSFYMISFISPILFLIPIIFSFFNGIKTTNKNLVAISSSKYIIKDTIDYRGLFFFQVKKDQELPKNTIGKIVLTDKNFYDLNSKTPVKLYINESDFISVQYKIKDIESFINREMITKYTKDLNLTDSIKYQLGNMKNIYPIISYDEISRSKKIAISLSFILSMLLYITFILFNNSILKSVIEEKTTKLSEVLFLFVKPINLMAGKIIGQGLATLLQLIVWCLVFIFYINILSYIQINYFENSINITNRLSDALGEIKHLPIEQICIYLPLFFIFGFLLNGTLTTIIGVYSSSKNSNYLMFLSNIMNLMGIYFGVFSATNPESKITKISYYIPFISYLTIPTTLTYNLSNYTINISLFILILSVIIMFYLAAKIYKKSIVLN